jgi:hypothetical protein
MLYPLWRLLVQVLPDGDPWERLEVVPRLHLYGSGARLDFPKYLVAATAAAAGLAPWAWGGAPARAWLTAAIAGAALGGVAVWLAWPPRAT